MKTKSKKAGPYKIPLRGLNYVKVRCAGCPRVFTIPQLPDDPVDPQSEGLLCGTCARKRDAAIARNLQSRNAPAQPDLFRK
jgi:hypothetical protein